MIPRLELMFTMADITSLLLFKAEVDCSTMASPGEKALLLLFLVHAVSGKQQTHQA